LTVTRLSAAAIWGFTAGLNINLTGFFKVFQYSFGSRFWLNHNQSLAINTGSMILKGVNSLAAELQPILLAALTKFSYPNPIKCIVSPEHRTTSQN
jgi:hypothetical protein